MKITLKEKILNAGKISLYLEYYKGSTVDANGKRQHLRTQEYLKIYLYQNPKTTKETHTMNTIF